MPVDVRYHCNNCGYEFQASELTPDELREAQRRNEPLSPISCPKCNRRDLRKISN
jgi:rubredoxin